MPWQLLTYELGPPQGAVPLIGESKVTCPAASIEMESPADLTVGDDPSGGPSPLEAREFLGLRDDPLRLPRRPVAVRRIAVVWRSLGHGDGAVGQRTRTVPIARRGGCTTTGMASSGRASRSGPFLPARATEPDGLAAEDLPSRSSEPCYGRSEASRAAHTGAQGIRAAYGSTASSSRSSPAWRCLSSAVATAHRWWQRCRPRARLIGRLLRARLVADGR